MLRRADWIAGHAGELGADGSRIAVAGNSGRRQHDRGGLALMAKDRHGPNIGYQVLLILGDRRQRRHGVLSRTIGTGRFLARAFMKYGWDLYAPDAATRGNPCVSRSVASLDQLKGLPPTRSSSPRRTTRCATRARPTPEAEGRRRGRGGHPLQRDDP